MALIKSTILAQISGSINGTTFAHNRGGAYARNRSLPSNPGTDRQDQVRTAMAAISQAYRDTLTEQQRMLWVNYGQNTTVLNRLGDSITLSGIAAFNRINLFRLASLGQTMVLTPPDPSGSPDPAPSFMSAAVGWGATGDVEIAVNLANAPSSGYGLVVYWSGLLSPGRSYYRGPYLDHTKESITGNTVTIEATGLPAEGDSAGRKVAARIICYDTTSSMPVWDIYVDPMLVPQAP